MTYPKIILVVLYCIVLLSSCFKDYDVDISDTVALGESITYLNGKETAYNVPFFNYSSFSKVINYGLLREDGLLEGESRLVSFNLLPLEEGLFTLCASRTATEGCGGALATFDHLVGGDLIAFTYELVHEEDGYFEVTQLDEAAQTVQGRFKVQFKRTSKNGNGDIVKGLPKRLTFKGVFHEEYEVF